MVVQQSGGSKAAMNRDRSSSDVWGLPRDGMDFSGRTDGDGDDGDEFLQTEEEVLEQLQELHRQLASTRRSTAPADAEEEEAPAADRAALRTRRRRDARKRHRFVAAPRRASKVLLARNKALPRRASRCR